MNDLECEDRVQWHKNEWRKSGWSWFCDDDVPTIVVVTESEYVHGCRSPAPRVTLGGDIMFTIHWDSFIDATSWPTRLTMHFVWYLVGLDTAALNNLSVLDRYLTLDDTHANKIDWKFRSEWFCYSSVRHLQHHDHFYFLASTQKMDYTKCLRTDRIFLQLPSSVLPVSPNTAVVTPSATALTDSLSNNLISM